MGLASKYPNLLDPRVYKTVECIFKLPHSASPVDSIFPTLFGRTYGDRISIRDMAFIVRIEYDIVVAELRFYDPVLAYPIIYPHMLINDNYRIIPYIHRTDISQNAFWTCHNSIDIYSQASDLNIRWVHNLATNEKIKTTISMIFTYIHKSDFNQG